MKVCKKGATNETTLKPHICTSSLNGLCPQCCSELVEDSNII